jgi:hypothetical protein
MGNASIMVNQHGMVFHLVYPLICVLLTRLNRAHLVSGVAYHAVALSGMGAAFTASTPSIGLEKAISVR